MLPRDADRALVDDLEREVRATLADLRGITDDLRPAILTDQGLVPALAWLRRGSTMRVRFDVQVPDRLASVVEATAFDVARALLQDSTGWPAGAEATLSAHRAGDALVVEIGTAATPAPADLVWLHDQVNAVGGTLRVVAAGDGYRVVRAELPWTS
jgi:signal transduction histidine kinase